MVDRVTTQTRTMNAQHNLQSSAALLAKMQDTATTLKKISVPSDDPVGTADSLRVHVAKSANDQYSRNLDDGTAWLATVDTSLSTTTDILHRIRDLTVQGASDGSLSPTGKEAIAKELEGLRGELLKQANTSFGGRTVFAGNSDAGVAFNADLTFNGGTGTVERRIDTNSTVRVDVDGAATFGTGPTSVFALVDTIVADLRSGVNVGSQLGGIDDHITAVLNQQSSVGARQNLITTAKDANVQRSATLEAQRAGIEDVDLGQVALQLKQQEITYQSALAVTGRTLSTTLMDFLR